MNFFLRSTFLSTAALAAGAAWMQAAPVTFDLQTATLADVQAAMNAGALSSVELSNLYLSRIARYDDKNATSGPKLNSIAQINPNLMAEAAAADQRRANGERGPLLGVPFTVKHSYAVQGLALTGGESNWTNLIAPYDSPVVTLLRNAGAVFLGYGNMSTFAISATTSTSEDAGTTRNAYVTGYVPGGSSGGPAVATGASFSFFSFGGETGGSIRNPSERAGIVGFKTSVGTVPIGGILALVPNRDVIGPMTRFTVDNATILDVVAQRQPTDIWYRICPILSSRPAPSGYVAGLTTSLAGKRFGVIGTYIGKTSPYTAAGDNYRDTFTTTAEVASLVTAASNVLTSLGATVKEVYLTQPVDSTATQISGNPRRMLYTDPYLDQSKAYAHRTLFESLVRTADDNEETLRVKTLARMAQSGSITTVQKDDVSNATDIPFTAEVGIEHFRATANILEEFDKWMADNQIDFLIWPTSGTKSSSGQGYAGTDLVNYLGLPLVTVPMGKIAASGEPTTLAFSGRLYEDAKILAVAHAYEQASKKRFTSPLAPPIAGETFVYDPNPSVAARSGSTEEGAIVAVAAAKRAETDAPVVSVAGRAKVQRSEGRRSLVFAGTAVDGSGLRRLQITVNGKKLPVKIARHWKARAAAQTFRTLADKGIDKVLVVAFAEDNYGNTVATAKSVKLPLTRLAAD